MKPGTEIASYSPTKAALAQLASKYTGLVFDVTKPEGMRDAKEAKKEIAVHRITLEKARVAEKAEALEYGRYVDSEAKKISEQLAALEDPITAQIEVETKREQREREEKVRLEVERLAKEEADRKAAEEARLAAERAEIAKARAELAAKEQAQAEAARLAQQKIDDEQRAARQKIEDEQRVARAKIEAEEREAKTRRDAEEARLQKIRDEALARERTEDERRRKAEAEAEAAAKVEREKKEAEARERARLVLEKADARTSLEIWRNRYGHMPEYAGVVRAIDECLEIA